jgi:hypothetical protein
LRRSAKYCCIHLSTQMTHLQRAVELLQRGAVTSAAVQLPHGQHRLGLRCAANGAREQAPPHQRRTGGPGLARRRGCRVRSGAAGACACGALCTPITLQRMRACPPLPRTWIHHVLSVDAPGAWKAQEAGEEAQGLGHLAGCWTTMLRAAGLDSTPAPAKAQLVQALQAPRVPPACPASPLHDPAHPRQRLGARRARPHQTRPRGGGRSPPAARAPPRPSGGTQAARPRRARGRPCAAAGRRLWR